ncbi:MAG: right-handed parallel beta-helix repeat-containing protein [Acidobacteriaceae bacterium]|nr:right-handed parallel beta-helix repeat-containing protein [Acidobacteriaceae bacterium]
MSRRDYVRAACAVPLVAMAVLALILLGTGSALAQYYVSPAGSDRNPGTLAAPFKTLEKARDAMRYSDTKTVYLRGGVYNRTKMLSLTSDDDGETWSYYPADGYNTAILDASEQPFHFQGDNNVILIQGGSHITIDGIQIQNYYGGGITIHGGLYEMWYGQPGPAYMTTGNAYYNTIKNCIVHDLQAGGGPWTYGDGQNPYGYWSTWFTALQALGEVKHTSFLNNVVYNIQTTAINIVSGDNPGAHDDSIMANNVVYNVNTSGLDSGAFYTCGGSGVKIINNYGRDLVGTNNNTGGKWANIAIYLDCRESNTVVSGNIISGTFDVGVHINNGSNNTITGNIFDFGTDVKRVLMHYQNYRKKLSGLTGNSFTNNIILANNASSFGEFIVYWGEIASDQAPTVKDNLYWNFGGGPVNFSGSVTDANPVKKDPQLSGWTYSIAPGSPVYEAPVNFPRIQGGWGPPGYVIPETGTAPSFPLNAGGKNGTPAVSE